MKERPHDRQNDAGIKADDLDLEIEPRTRPGKETVTASLGEAGALVTSRTPGKASVSSQLPPIMRKATGVAIELEAGAAVDRASSSSGSALPAELRGELEDALGVSLDGVRVHTDWRADAAARAVGAKAFARGKDIYFSSGSFQPDVAAGRELIAHEVAHTAQSTTGAAAATGVSSPGDAHEVEADAFAQAFITGANRASSGMGAPLSAAAPSGMVHRTEGQRLENRHRSHAFHQTQSLAEFEAEVQRFIATQVRSRSTNEETGEAIHRERALFPPGRLRNMYFDSDRGGTITLEFEFISNGYSFRQVQVSRGDGPPPREPEPDRDDDPTPAPDSPRRPDVRTEQLDDEVETEIVMIVLEQVASEVAEEAAKRVATELLGDILAVLGAIATMYTIGREIVALSDPNVAEAATGFSATAYAHRMAQVIWNGRSVHVETKVREAIQHYLAMSSHRYHRLGEYMQERYDEGNSRYQSVIARLNEAHTQADSSTTQGQSFNSQAELAAHLVATTPGQRASSRYWMGLWHQSYDANRIYRINLSNNRSTE